MIAHTPGPWFYESADRGNRYVIRFKAPHYTGRGEVLAQHIERAEDAKLIAAAPALAEALEAFRTLACECNAYQIDSGHHIDCPFPLLRDAADAALRAAGRLP